MATAIHIAPDDSFDDWVVRDENGREPGHYPTREEAEIVGETRASAATSWSLISLTAGPIARALQRDGWPDGSAQTDGRTRHTVTPPTCCRAHASNWGSGMTPG
jgi:hypothetical protein